jgi:hypothetical protein
MRKIKDEMLPGNDKIPSKIVCDADDSLLLLAHQFCHNSFQIFLPPPFSTLLQPQLLHTMNNLFYI